MHNGYGVLHALLCTFYYQESVETIKKMDAPGSFFLYDESPPLLCFQQEAVRLCEGSVGWIGKVNDFSVPTLQTPLSPTKVQ